MMKQRKGLNAHRQSGLKKTSSWATVSPAKDKHLAPINKLKLYVTRSVNESEASLTYRRAIKEETIAIYRDLV